MFKPILLAFVCFCLVLKTGSFTVISDTQLIGLLAFCQKNDGSEAFEAIKCYHCYDTFNRTLSLGSGLDDADFGEKYVQCGKDMNNWNTWECPSKWPVCVIMSAKVNSVKKRYEIGRSCGERNFCSKYRPPIYVQVESCRECNTSLCNDFPTVPPPGPLFVFNVNINLNVKKNPLTVAGDKDHD